MKALIKKEAIPGIWMEKVPTPMMGPDEVLIKTLKTSICGTDIHIYKWDAWAQKTVPVPLIIGHEFMGKIAAIGRNVKGLNVGDRVSGEGHIVCNQCVNCLKGLKHVCMRVLGLGVKRSGCFAEYFTLPAENVFVLPPTISDEVASIFDPFGNAVHTSLQFDLVGEDVLITGAGPIGIMAAAIVRKAGARKVIITDINDYRLHLASIMGATAAINVSKNEWKDVLKEQGIDNGFTVGLEMSGTQQGLNTMISSMRDGGKIALLGILPPGATVDWDIVIFKMLTLKGIYGREIFGTWFKMVHLIESGLNLEPIITHRFPVNEFQKGFDVMSSGHSGKVILDWV
jgi:threonine 3-dehydrogenase